MTLVVDVAQVTDTIWTSLTLDTQLSLRQTGIITVPVGAMLVRGRAYLPLVSTPRPGIHGRVTEDGVPVAGIPLDLRFYNGTAWSSLATTYTQADGWFTFANMPGLSAGQGYYVRYQNTTGAGRRLDMAYTRADDLCGGQQCKYRRFRHCRHRASLASEWCGQSACRVLSSGRLALRRRLTAHTV